MNTIPIIEEMLQNAIQDEKKIISQKGGMWNEMSDYCDRIGSIGQQCVSNYLKEEGLAFEETPFFDSTINKDLFDFKIIDQKIDCKASPIGEFDYVHPKSRLLVRNDKQEIDKKIDYYLFVKVDLSKMITHIAGIINYWDFWKLGQTSEDYEMKIKKPCHFVFAYQLTPLLDFIYH